MSTFRRPSQSSTGTVPRSRQFQGIASSTPKVSRTTPALQKSTPGLQKSTGSRPVSGASSKKRIPPCPAAAERSRLEEKEELETPAPKAYENPAFSIPLKKVQTNPIIILKEKKKTIRRNIPPCEDLNELKKIYLSVRKTPDITVAEFVGLVAPYTGDNGTIMHDVLTEDMNSFRNLAGRIYETMTQDVSDVLTNQHLQLREFEQERTTIYTEKMMRAINEIYSYASKFDFEAYYEDKKRYLASIFPVPKLLEVDSDEAEMHRRQQAYHRLNWLKSEGERLAAENKHLQQRLIELKREQKEEMLLAQRKEAEAEAAREELEAEEAAVQQELENLGEKLEETVIDTEAAIRVATDEANITAPLKKGGSKQTAKKKKKPNWVTEAAAEIEEKAIEGDILAEAAQTTIPPGLVAGAIKKVRKTAQKSKFKKPEPTTPEQQAEPTSPFHFSPIKTPPSRPPPPQERSPFHYSPIKTPPPKPQAPPSPFHYSPIKTPPPQPQAPPSPFHYSPIKTPPPQPQAPPSPFHYSPPPVVPEEPPISPPPMLHTTRLRSEHVTVEERGGSGGGRQEEIGAAAAPPLRTQQAEQPVRRGRRGAEFAPRDTWGGF